MACKYYSEEDVERLLDMPTAINAMAGAFLALAAGKAENVPRKRARGHKIVLHSMCAAAEYLGLVGWKQYTTSPSGAKFQVGLYDQQSGSLVALIAADRLGQMRTGAVTGLATRYLSQPAADRVGLFGTGWQAESQLEAVVTARSVRQALVYSRDPARRTDFAERMAARLKIEVLAVETAQEAVTDLPIVITATTSKTPVFEGGWLTPGTLVCAVGSNWLNKAELDAETVRRSTTVVCDDIDCCRNEAGDLATAEAAGVFDWSRSIDLAEVVAGKAEPLTPNPITLFKSVGMAVEDVALGSVLVERAKSAGLGSELPF